MGETVLEKCGQTHGGSQTKLSQVKRHRFQLRQALVAAHRAGGVCATFKQRQCCHTFRKHTQLNESAACTATSAHHSGSLSLAVLERRRGMLWLVAHNERIAAATAVRDRIACAPCSRCCRAAVVQLRECMVHVVSHRLQRQQ